MTKLQHMLTLGPDSLAELAEVYASDIQPAGLSAEGNVVPLASRAWQIALRLAEGDARRIQRLPDGGLLVLNRPELRRGR